jgi:enoyl-CoA hydratase/carnithine racemase
LIGEPAVRQLLLEARLIGAREALRLRLVDRVICDWLVDAEIEAWCEAMSSGTVAAVRSWSVARESRLFSSLWLGPIHRAVLQKWKARE